MSAEHVVEAGPSLPQRLNEELYLVDLARLHAADFRDLLLPVRDALAAALEAANMWQGAVDKKHAMPDRTVEYRAPVP